VFTVNIRVLGVSSNYSFRGLIVAFSRLYKYNPTPPHCYLIYDLIYEPENIDVLVKLLDNNTIESYLLAWRGPRGNVLHVWGPSKCELIHNIVLDASRPLYIELYSETST